MADRGLLEEPSRETAGLEPTWDGAGAARPAGTAAVATATLPTDGRALSGRDPGTEAVCESGLSACGPRGEAEPPATHPILLLVVMLTGAGGRLALPARECSEEQAPRVVLATLLTASVLPGGAGPTLPWRRASKRSSVFTRAFCAAKCAL